MAISFKLPTINADSALLLNTPLAATDVVLANGVLSILDESGATALVIKATDFLNFSYDVQTNGTANKVDVDLTGVTMIANGVYTLTVSAPYAVNFFGGGQETNAVYQARTYTVSLGGTPVAQDLRDAFVSRINADVNAYFSAAAVAGDIVRITADAAGFGPLNVVAPANSVISDNVAWVAPVGTADEVLQYIPDASIVTGVYNRYTITYRKLIRSNIVNGLQIVKPVQALVYINTTVAGPEPAAVIAKLTSILNGSYTPVAGYLGCPAV